MWVYICTVESLYCAHVDITGTTWIKGVPISEVLIYVARTGNSVQIREIPSFRRDSPVLKVCEVNMPYVR